MSRRVRAGGAYVEITATTAKLQRGLAQAGRNVSAFANRINATGQSVQAVFEGLGSRLRQTGAFLAGMGGVGIAGLGVITKRAMDSVDAISKLHDATQAGVRYLSEMQYVVEQSGGNFSELESIMMGLAQTQREVSAGMGRSIRILRQLGVEVSSLQGLTPEDLFDRLMGSIMGVEDVAARADFSRRLFRTTRPVIMYGRDRVTTRGKTRSKDIEDTRQEARDLGTSYGETTAKALVELGNSLTRIKTIFASIGRTIAVSLANPLTAIMEKVVEYAPRIRDFADKWAMVGLAIGAVSAGMVVVGTVMGSIGTIIAPLGSIFGLIGFAISSAISLLPAFLLGLGFIVTKLGAIAAMASKVIGGMLIGKTIAPFVEGIGQGVMGAYHASKAASAGAEAARLFPKIAGPAARLSYLEDQKDIVEAARKDLRRFAPDDESYSEDLRGLVIELKEVTTDHEKASRLEHLQLSAEAAPIMDKWQAKEVKAARYREGSKAAFGKAREAMAAIPATALLKSGAQIVAVSAIKKQLDAIVEASGPVWQNMKTAASKAFTGIGEAFGRVVDYIRSNQATLAEDFSMIGEAIQVGEIGTAFDLLGNLATIHGSLIVAEITESLIDTFSQLNALLKGTGLVMYEALIAPWDEIITKAGEILDGLKVVGMGLVGIITPVIEGLHRLVEVLDAIRDTIAIDVTGWGQRAWQWGKGLVTGKDTSEKREQLAIAQRKTHEEVALGLADSLGQNWFRVTGGLWKNIDKQFTDLPGRARRGEDRRDRTRGGFQSPDRITVFDGLIQRLNEMAEAAKANKEKLREDSQKVIDAAKAAQESRKESMKDYLAGLTGREDAVDAARAIQDTITGSFSARELQETYRTIDEDYRKQQISIAKEQIAEAKKTTDYLSRIHAMQAHQKNIRAQDDLVITFQ